MDDIKVECGEEIHKAFENISEEVIESFKKQFMELYQKELSPWQIDFFNKIIDSIREREEEQYYMQLLGKVFMGVDFAGKGRDYTTATLINCTSGRHLGKALFVTELLKKDHIIVLDEMSPMPTEFARYPFEECPLTPELPPIPDFEKLAKQEFKRKKEDRYPRNMLKGRKGRY